METGSLVSGVLLPALVSGVVVFAFQRWLENQFKKRYAELEQRLLYFQRSHETLVNAYSHVWRGLVEIEEFIKREIPAEIRSGAVNAEGWPVIIATYKTFRAEMLFLPDDLCSRTEHLVESLQLNLNALLDALRTYVAARQATKGAFDDTEYVGRANDLLNKANRDYREGLEQLRVDFQRACRSLFGLDSPA